MRTLTIMSIGNNYVVIDADEVIESHAATVEKAIEARAAWITLEDGSAKARRKAKLFVPHITGFYTQDYRESASSVLIKKQIALSDAVVDQIKKSESGEDWKDS